MTNSGDWYAVTMRRQKRKFIPKKILRHTKLNISDKYTAKVSVWIADTPESHLMPTVNLVIQHNGDKVRLCFPDAVTMCLALKGLTHFLDDIMVITHERHSEAVEEFLAFHHRSKPTPLNDYTVYTVIQDLGTKKNGKLQKVNTQTGEILEEG